MRLRSLVAAVAVSALGISLAACGGNNSGNASGGSSGGGNVTLKYWASNQGTSLDNDKAVLTPVLKKFTDETGIKVDLEVIGWNDLQTRIQTAITSGQGAGPVPTRATVPATDFCQTSAEGAPASMIRRLPSSAARRSRMSRE